MHRRSLVALAGFAVAAITALASAACVSFDWSTFDDPVYVLRQAAVVDPANATWIDRLATPGMGHPMPVTAASLALDFAAYGYDARGFHRTNLLLWGCIAWLTFVWALAGMRIATGRAPTSNLPIAGAALATLVVLSHPVTAEPVAWITSRKDLLAVMFALAALIAAAGPTGESASPQSSARSVAISTLFLGLSFLSKASAIALPLFTYLVGRLAGTPRRVLRVAVAAQLTAAAVVAAAASFYQRHQEFRVDPLGAGWLGGIGHIALGHASRFGISPSRPPLYPGLFSEHTVAHALLGFFFLCVGLGVALAVTVWLARAAPSGPEARPILLLSFAACTAYAPVSGVLGHLEMFVADRYLLLPLCVFGAPALALSIVSALDRARGSARWGIVAAAVAVSVVFTVARQPTLASWRRGETLWAAQREVWGPNAETLANGSFIWLCRQTVLTTGAYVSGWGVPKEPDLNRRRALLEQTMSRIDACLSYGRPDCASNPKGCMVYEQLLHSAATGERFRRELGGEAR